jgi:hypothetical protein
MLPEIIEVEEDYQKNINEFENTLLSTFKTKKE